MPTALVNIQSWMAGHHFPILLVTGSLLIAAFYIGKTTRYLKLPSIIGYMLIGLILGPSLVNFIDNGIQSKLSFVTELALGFVAFTIGLELSFDSLRRQGMGIISIILAESFAAFAVTFGGVYLLTRDLAVSLIFASFAPASAPAGTVAVIREYRAKGTLTKALYAVVGFDDGLAIIIFGFTAAIVRMILTNETGGGGFSFAAAFFAPAKEILLSILLGGLISLLLTGMIRRLKSRSELLIVIVAVVLITNGLCGMLHLSIILTNMVVGLLLVNLGSQDRAIRLGETLTDLMPLLFVLFFTLAGANLHIGVLPSLGLLGLIYIICRSAGLMGGAALGGMLGKVEPKVKKYVGMGILSQAGVAIGLALIVKHEFAGLGRIIETPGGILIHRGDMIGAIGITTITATCIFFEIIGPILTKIALSRAGEIENE